MICSLLIDPDDSIDFSGNGAEVMGRPLAAYPLLSAKGSQSRRIYALTDSEPVRRISIQLGAILLDMPRDIKKPTDTELIVSGYKQIVKDLTAEKDSVELIVLLFANTGTVNAKIIDQGIAALLEDTSLDSATTVSPYDRWTPRRALRETKSGRLEPYATCVPEAGTAWFPDWGASILRPRVLDTLNGKSPDLSWLGKNVLPLKQAGGGPVDYQWQVPKLEYWLRKQGVQDSPRPEPLPKLAPVTKPDRRA